MLRFLLSVLLLVVGLGMTVRLQSLEWQSDVTTALLAAQEEEKPVLLYFSGEEWCCWCKKLEQNIMTSQDFQTRIANRFVLVKISFPQKLAARTEESLALAAAYEVASLPTMVVVSCTGEVLGRVGYMAVSPSRYAEHLLFLAGL